MDALVIGGTRFLGRHTVAELREHGYGVTLFNRGNHENPFADADDVGHVTGDRTNPADVEAVAGEIDPEVVIDCVAYHPSEVRHAAETFADSEAYVVVSSGAAYAADEIPKREGDTRLHECTDDQATDDSWETYGPRKAEIDREVARAGAEGVNATSVRPPVIYGPHDYTERLDYWIDRVENHDRVIVPGDGTNLWHLVYAGDVASALRIVAEQGDPGEAYNVGDGHAPTLGEWVERLAAACDTEVETVFAGARELAAADLELTDFPLYQGYPHLLDTNELRALGWEPTPHDESLPETVTDHRASDRTGRDRGPDSEAEERVLSVLDTVGTGGSGESDG